MMASLGRWAKGLGILTALGMVTLGGGPAFAQPEGEATVFVDLGRWTIFERPRARICELHLTSGEVDGLVYSKAMGRPGQLRLLTQSRSYTPMGDVLWAFDNRSFDGRLYGDAALGPVSDSSAIEQQFRQARFLTVSSGGQVLARLSLKTSSAGFRLLKQCSEQWRYAPARIAAAPSVPTPAPVSTGVAARAVTPEPPAPLAQQSPPANSAPAITGPYPPNRGLSPLDPGGWVRQDDFRRLSADRFGSGTLRFTLIVNEEGRAEECVVNATSGSRDFDERACRVLQRRARFEPATDETGNTTSARYNSQIRFAIEN